MRNVQLMIRILFTLFMLTWAVAVTVPAMAADLVVTRYFSGLWDQPKQESQGIMLQIIDQEEDGKKKAVAYWFTYGDDLDTAWYIAIGHVEGDQVVMALYSVLGVGFMQDDLPDDDSSFEVGTLVLSFRNCNHGTASFKTSEEDLGVGSFDIKKLAGLYNSRCSGGISDDTPSNAKPVKLDLALEPARDDISGKGKAQFWERVDRSDFHVSAEDIPDGDYDLQVCATSEGTLTVTGGEGAVQFRSPAADGKLLLTFDPRNCLIELHDGAGAALTSGENVLAVKDKGNSGGGDGNGNGRMEIEIELDNTGVIPAAEGEVSYIEKNNSTEFEVEIKGVALGTYPFFVDGVEQGQISVVADDDDDNKHKGKLRFSDPQKDERELLDFDPRGKWIEVTNGSDVILEVLLPE